MLVENKLKKLLRASGAVHLSHCDGVDHSVMVCKFSVDGEPVPASDTSETIKVPLKTFEGHDWYAISDNLLTKTTRIIDNGEVYTSFEKKLSIVVMSHGDVEIGCNVGGTSPLFISFASAVPESGVTYYMQYYGLFSEDREHLIICGYGFGTDGSTMATVETY